SILLERPTACNTCRCAAMSRAENSPTVLTATGAGCRTCGRFPADCQLSRRARAVSPARRRNPVAGDGVSCSMPGQPHKLGWYGSRSRSSAMSRLVLGALGLALLAGPALAAPPKSDKDVRLTGEEWKGVPTGPLQVGEIDRLIAVEQKAANVTPAA